MNTGENTTSQRHAFISYVREDKARVDRLQEALEAAGISVWRDTKDLWPGQSWEDKIRGAIKSDSLAFIACFSEHSVAREKSYQNAELALAADEYRLRPPTTEWLVPVRFSECPVPEWPLGAGRTLNSLHRTDLFGETETIQTVRLVQAVHRIVSPVPTVSPAVTEGIAELRKADSPRQVQAQEIKSLLRDPNGDIMLEDVAMDIMNSIRDELNDAHRFPTALTDTQANDVAFARFFIHQIHAYENALEPAFELILLGAMYGLPRHEAVWTRIVHTLASTAQQRSGNMALLQLREYPLVLSSYIASISAISRANYGALRAFVADPEIRATTGKIPIVLHTNPRLVVADVEWIASSLCLATDKGVDLDETLVSGIRTGRVGRRHTPMSDHIFSLLEPVFSGHFGDEDEYAEAFDRAEVFMDLMPPQRTGVSIGAAEARMGGTRGGIYVPTTRRRRNLAMPSNRPRMAGRRFWAESSVDLLTVQGPHLQSWSPTLSTSAKGSGNHEQSSTPQGQSPYRPHLTGGGSNAPGRGATSTERVGVEELRS